MTADLFPNILQHIKSHTNCRVDKKILVVLNNHMSHTSGPSIIYTKEKCILLLTLPPHCSHRKQTLDVGGPFKSNLKIAFKDLMLINPGIIITITGVPRTEYIRIPQKRIVF